MGMAILDNVFHYEQMVRKDDPRNNPEARRLRILRYALGFGYHGGLGAFAVRMGWGASEVSQWENGIRPIARHKMMMVHRTVPGLDPLYLLEGRMHESSMPIRQAIEQAEKAIEAEEAEKVSLSRKG